MSDIFFRAQYMSHIDGLVQGCSISIANALEILQSCTKPSVLYGTDSAKAKPVSAAYMVCL